MLNRTNGVLVSLRKGESDVPDNVDGEVALTDLVIQSLSLASRKHVTTLEKASGLSIIAEDRPRLAFIIQATGMGYDGPLWMPQSSLWLIRDRFVNRAAEWLGEVRGTRWQPSTELLYRYILFSMSSRVDDQYFSTVCAISSCSRHSEPY